MFGWSDEENKILDEMVAQKGISREQAEAEYKKYKMVSVCVRFGEREEWYSMMIYSRKRILSDLRDSRLGERERSAMQRHQKFPRRRQ